MGERLYSKIRDFLAENGVTFPNRIDINMSYDQLYKLLRVVNNIEVEVDWVKEDLIENIMEELDRKKIERIKILQNLGAIYRDALNSSTRPA